MTASRTFFSCLLLFSALCATTARAAFTITGDEVWNGVANPRAADGVTLNNGVYTIPTSVTLGAGANIFLNDPLSATDDPSPGITFEFLAGTGGLTFADPTSTIDTFIGGRNQPVRTFTLNMNNNNITAATPGAGRIINGPFVLAGLTGDSMGVTINSTADVTLGAIDISVNDAVKGNLTVNAGGLVDIDMLATRDASTGGSSGSPVSITGERLVIGDIDTRSQRIDNPMTGFGNGTNGNITLRALGQPENNALDPAANTFAANTVLLEGDIVTNATATTGPVNGLQGGGNLTVTGAKVTLAPTFTADLTELSASTGVFTVNTGIVGNGQTQATLFVNNSAETPNAVNYNVLRDNFGSADVSWVANASGNWFTNGNWTPAAAPNGTAVRAVFGSAITSQQTIYLNQAATVNGLVINTAAKVAIAGTAPVTLDAASGNATLEVQQGSHEMQTGLTLADNTTATIAAGAQLDVNGVLNLGGRTLTVSGGGQLNVNNIATGGGSISSSATLGTAGLTGITGDLTSTGTLDIDIAGAAVDFYDAFSVSGAATLSGTLNVDLIDGFTVTGGQSFTVLTAASVSAASLTLSGPDASAFTLIKNPTSLVLQAAAAGDADFDNDGDVDGSDFLRWQRGIGPGTNATGDADGNGVVNGADLSIWRSSFGPAAAPVAGAVPEPAAATMLLAVGVAISLLRRRSADRV